MSLDGGGERERLVRWSDPRELAAAAGKMSGIDFLAAIQAGKLPAPPVAELIGFTLEDIQEGFVVGSITAQEYHYNPMGTMHGGVITTVLDSVMGCAVQTRLPTGRGYTTLELKVNFLRPITESTGVLRAIGSVVHLGSRTAMAEGKLMDSNERLLAQASTSCIILDSR